ncbi:MFS family permease [Paraburkholderia phenoliruptrix]|nr:MFS transporter [Paraburkholderia phenoliruptrix]MDR6423833.1 MFS family permease [Paraburkholderia phenoliruptrix]
MKVFGYRGWAVLTALSVMMCISMSLPIYGASVVNTYMATALDWNRKTLGLLTSVNMVTAALLNPVAANIVGRIGIRRSLVIGCLTMVAGGAWLATVATQPWEAVVAFSVLMGMTSAFSGIIPCQAGVAAWFVRRRTLAISVLFAVVGAASFAVISLIGAVVESAGGWRSGWWVFVGAGVVGLLTSLLFVRNAPTGEDAQSSELHWDKAHEAQTTRELSLSKVVRSPLLWGVAFAMLAIASGSAFMIAHSQVYLRGIGISAAAAAFAMPLVSAAMVLGNLGFNLLAASTDLRRAQIIAMGVFVLGFIALANLHTANLTTAYLAVGLVGAGFGAGQVGVMGMLGHYWSTRLFPMLTAIVMLIQTVGGCLVAILAGAYFDAHQTYLPVISVIVALNVLAILGLWAMAPQRKQHKVEPRSTSV